jgi:prepilin-type N-terminal cleavage/methylation domain-containing protein/prepilin-type processing-associated H-X9-DG protein
MPRWNRRSAFTLVELLVVIAIIGVLVALLLPAVQAAREAARRSQCTNNMKQVALGLLNFESANEALPGGSSYEERNVPTADRNNWKRWVVEVLPFMEQTSIHSQVDVTEPFFLSTTPAALRNRKLAAETVITALICPSDPQAASPILEDRVASGDNPPVSQGLWYKGSMGPTIPDHCAFLVSGMTAAEQNAVCMGADYGSAFATSSFKSNCFAGIKGMSCPDSSVCVGMICRTKHGVELRQVSDGTSNTILIGETLPGHSEYNCTFCENMNVGSTHVPLNAMESDVPGATPRSTHDRSNGFKSLHQGGVNFAFSDGSVHFVSEAADWYLVNALGTKAADDSTAGFGS